jgi:hypothetical protein
MRCFFDVNVTIQPDTIELANLVVKGMDVEDPGLFIQITDREMLHRALALATT